LRNVAIFIKSTDQSQVERRITAKARIVPSCRALQISVIPEVHKDQRKGQQIEDDIYHEHSLILGSKSREEEFDYVEGLDDEDNDAEFVARTHHQEQLRTLPLLLHLHSAPKPFHLAVVPTQQVHVVCH